MTFLRKISNFLPDIPKLRYGIYCGTNTKKELLEAMIKVSETGLGPKDQIPSIGCSIKWKE